MARFQFDLRIMPTRGNLRAMVAQRTLRALNLGEIEPDEPRGPGWFDSSWDLLCGLEVREGLSSDTPLNDWLALCLRVAPAGSAFAAERDEQPGACLVPATAHRALGNAVKLGDLGFAVAAEVAHLDEFSQFGIDGLELV